MGVPPFVLKCRDDAWRVLWEFDYEGAIEGTHLELLAVSALVLNNYARYADKVWPRGCNRELELLGEVAAIHIVEHRAVSSFSALKSMLQAVYAELQHTDIDERLPKQQERASQLREFCFISAAAAEIQRRHDYTVLTGDRR